MEFTSYQPFNEIESTMVLDLYTIACRSYEFFNAADGFEEAFDECLSVKGVDMILQRVRVTDVEKRWIG